jgi:hypothetical protein
MERIIYEGTKKQCKNLTKLVYDNIGLDFKNYPELVKNDYSIIDETFDSKLEILKKIEAIGFPNYPKENILAEKLAKSAIEEWSDELMNADVLSQNGLKYYIEQAILSGISEFKKPTE